MARKAYLILFLFSLPFQIDLKQYRNEPCTTCLNECIIPLCFFFFCQVFTDRKRYGARWHCHSFCFLGVGRYIVRFFKCGGHGVRFHYVYSSQVFVFQIYTDQPLFKGFACAHLAEVVFYEDFMFKNYLVTSKSNRFEHLAMTATNF